jgi:hypothetical protein
LTTLVSWADEAHFLAGRDLDQALFSSRPRQRIR